MNEMASLPQHAARPQPAPAAAAAWPHTAQLTALSTALNAQSLQRVAAPNRTGLPDALKTGIESLSGVAMDGVKVHYNSAQPAQLNAHAYAQGTDIHLAPGQEQHLPHEAWHVVQQAQGRVRPTMQLYSGPPVNDDRGLEHEADLMGARAATLQLRRHSLRATTALTPVQRHGEDSWWNSAEALAGGTLAGGALGMGLAYSTFGLPLLPMIGATLAGSLLGLQAAIETPSLGYIGGETPTSGPLKGISSFLSRPTRPGTLVGFIPGESRHKKIIRIVFDNIAPRGSESWTEHQKELESGTKGVDMDPKLCNDIYVANIMKSPQMMGTALTFLTEMSTLYGTNGQRAEMRHLWPDQDTSGNKNTTYRGYLSVAKSFFPDKEKNPLSLGLQANKDKLAELSRKHQRNEPLSLEETNYILRAMGQLRDVMKTEKGMVPTRIGEKKEPGLIKEHLSNGSKWDNGIAKKNRIRVSGDAQSDDTRANPQEHAFSRWWGNRWFQPFGTLRMLSSGIYRIINPNKTGATGSFDYLQGTSGTTLDMLNFFLAHGKSADEATQLMQVFYAHWHAVAPDGNAHSQVESICTMMQYLHGTSLNGPIMAPITSLEDSKLLVQGGYATELNAQQQGFLDYAQPKIVEKDKGDKNED